MDKIESYEFDLLIFSFLGFGSLRSKVLKIQGGRGPRHFSGDRGLRYSRMIEAFPGSRGQLGLLKPRDALGLLRLEKLSGSDDVGLLWA